MSKQTHYRSLTTSATFVALAGTIGILTATPLAMALELTGTTDTQTLLDALLAGPLPERVTIQQVTIVPASPDQDTAIGTYSGFNLVSQLDPDDTLVLPDGIVLTTGDLLRPFGGG